MMASKQALDPRKIRADFPVLSREVRPGVPLIYLDNAATSQKPSSVIETMNHYYKQMNSNIHRGIHQLAEEATIAYEEARNHIAKFIGAKTWQEIVFTRNTTEAINLVAYSWGRSKLGSGDRVLLTEMEHHANIVPWHMLAEANGVELDFIPITDDGKMDLEAYRDLLQKGPKLVSFTHMSNVLGTINPVVEMTSMAHEAGALVLIDAAQSVPHITVDVTASDADFIAFSSHKMLGPTGIGVLYGKKDILNDMPPFLGGGDMIKRVHLDGFSTNDAPYKFEAGTPAIAEALGFEAAIDYLENLGMENVHAHEEEMVQYALERLEEVPGLTVIGPEAEDRGGVAAFTFEGIHPHDVAQILDQDGIAVRAGHHCAMPVHDKFCIPATTRASFYIYNTTDEVDMLIEGLYGVKKVFS
jgi:cysteine desulfurase/selenocysteine lyase